MSTMSVKVEVEVYDHVKRARSYAVWERTKVSARSQACLAAVGL